MKDIEQPLIAGRGKKQMNNQKKKFQQCQLKIKALKNKNNQLQKHINGDLQKDMRKAVHQQLSYIEKQVDQLRKYLQQMSKQYNDPTSKNKIKQLWQQASKQIQRNKKVMEQFVNRASSASFARNSQSFHRLSRSVKQQNKQISNVSLIDTEDLKDQIALQQKLIAQRNAALTDIQKSNNKIRQIMTDMANLVEQQGETVDQIGQNMNKAKQNVVVANEQLDDAVRYQKKILIILVLGAGGTLFYLFFK